MPQLPSLPCSPPFTLCCRELTGRGPRAFRDPAAARTPSACLSWRPSPGSGRNCHSCHPPQLLGVGAHSLEGPRGVEEPRKCTENPAFWPGVLGAPGKPRSHKVWHQIPRGTWLQAPLPPPPRACANTLDSQWSLPGGSGPGPERDPGQVAVFTAEPFPEAPCVKRPSVGSPGSDPTAAPHRPLQSLEHNVGTQASRL